jgi:hypothetical protein
MFTKTARRNLLERETDRAEWMLIAQFGKQLDDKEVRRLDGE